MRHDNKKARLALAGETGRAGDKQDACGLKYSIFGNGWGMGGKVTPLYNNRSYCQTLAQNGGQDA